MHGSILIKQPLVHFLVIGLALFLVYKYTATRNEIAINNNTIVVDRDSLLTFMQYRSKAFNKEHFSEVLDSMNDDERQRLIDDLIREEVLYREAQTLQLDENDYVIKQRLIQKLEFLTNGFITTAINLGDKDVQSYYEEHKHEYYVQPIVTFTHIFFDYEQHDRETAGLLATETLKEINAQQISFSDGLRFGDRYLYHRNYVERTPDYISSHFGAQMAEAVFQLPVNPRQWAGPYQSPYGLHLVMLTKKESGRIPELADINDRVKTDAERVIVNQRTEEAINKIIGSYDIEVSFEY